jgi:hypothetical protein
MRAREAQKVRGSPTDLLEARGSQSGAWCNNGLLDWSSNRPHWKAVSPSTGVIGGSVVRSLNLESVTTASYHAMILD